MAGPTVFTIRQGKPKGGGKGYLGQEEVAATLDTHCPNLWEGDEPMTEDDGRQTRGLTVRRLTPVECERLQSFPDHHTDIPWNNRGHAPDGPRYKALGNSMNVNVMRWIGEGIRQVEDERPTP